VAKSRAQRKAEQRKRRQQELEERARRSQSKAQHDTQVPESGDVAEVEAALEAGAAAADEIDQESSVPAERAEPVSVEAEPVPVEAGTASEQRLSRREQRRAEKERARRARESAERRAPKEEKPERQRGRVMSFFASVIAELRKVQWPDRETLVQASAVTLLFVAVAAAYLGALDAIFGWLVDRLIT
jgi:preprotein translocase subunit SecE